MTLLEWATTLERRDEMKRVAETTLPNGRWVSTVWLGLDHSFGFRPGRPLIFETMVFGSQDEMSELDCERYSTEADALVGHEKLCAKWAVETPVEEGENDAPE